MFVIERDLRTLAVGVAHLHAFAGGLGDGGGLSRREQEGRVRGEDDMQLGMGPMRGERIEILGILAEGVETLRRSVGRYQVAQMVGSHFEGLSFQFLDQSRQILERQLSCLQLARQIMGKLEHRIEERGFLRPCVQFAQSFGQRVE